LRVRLDRDAPRDPELACEVARRGDLGAGSQRAQLAVELDPRGARHQCVAEHQIVSGVDEQ